MKMNIQRQFIGFCAFVILIGTFSCEERMVVIPDSSDIDSDRIVLIEEFSGVKCPNCPDGNIQVEELIARFPSNLVSVTVHSDFLATPFTDSKFDFRSEEAQQLEDFLGSWFGKPEATINRVLFDNEPFLRTGFPDQWPSYVESELLKPAMATVTIEHEYDPVARELTSTVTATAKVAISGDLRISAYLTESHIKDKQDDNGTKVPDYEHNHVLRKVLSNIEGDPVGSSLGVGESFNRSYSFTIPPEDGWWVDDNMEMIAFISYNNSDNKEIIQAAQISIKEE